MFLTEDFCFKIWPENWIAYHDFSCVSTGEAEFKKSFDCPAILKVHFAPNGNWNLYMKKEQKYENKPVKTREMHLYCVTELQGIFVCTSAYSVVFCS